MKPKTNEQLCVLAQRGDVQAQEQLVKNNLGYIQKVANELYQSVGLGNSELGIDHDDLIQEGSIGLLRAISLYDPDKKIKFLTYAGQAVRNAMMDLISAAFATFEQRLQSKEDGFPMERINLDDLLPGEDSMQRSELIADPYAAEPEKIMMEEENRWELYEGLRRIPERDRAYLLYRFGFEDDLEHPLIGAALHFRLPSAPQRYNTLDFASKIVCQGVRCPLWIPLPRATLFPFGYPIPTGILSSLLDDPESRGCAPLNTLLIFFACVYTNRILRLPCAVLKMSL